MKAWVWSFEQYCSASSARASITDWRKDLSPARRAIFDVFIDRIAKMKSWPTGICNAIRGHPGFWELRWTAEKVEHRILGYYGGPSIFVMVVGCTHKGRVYDPPEAFQTMKDRRRKISGEEGVLVDYEPQPIGDQKQGVSPWPSGRPN